MSTFASWVLIAAPIQLWSLNTPLFKRNNSLCNYFLFEKQRIIWETPHKIAFRENSRIGYPHPKKIGRTEGCPTPL